MEFFGEYGLFLAKILTVLFALVIVLAVSSNLRAKQAEKGQLQIRPLNEVFEKNRQTLAHYLLSRRELRAQQKLRKKQEKEHQKKFEKDGSNRVFVLNFKGDLKASAVQSLREEITAVLSMAGEKDEVIVRLESGGGMVHAYGLAASQLDRIRKKGIALTVCIDKVAASGGYMMACVADKILAAPFAFVGSIGVVAQIPNFNRLLKKHEVDFEVLTAGEYKRTLTILGENTDKGREKFIRDLEETHLLFKDFIRQHRSHLNVDEVATGEVWLGTRSCELGLVDKVMTSDEYISSQIETCQVYEVSYALKRSLQEKISMTAEESVDNLLVRWLRRFSQPNYFS